MENLIKGELLVPTSDKSGFYYIKHLEEVMFVRYDPLHKDKSVIIVTITKGYMQTSGDKSVGHSLKLFTDVFKRKEIQDNYEIY